MASTITHLTSETGRNVLQESTPEILEGDISEDIVYTADTVAR